MKVERKINSGLRTVCRIVAIAALVLLVSSCNTSRDVVDSAVSHGAFSDRMDGCCIDLAGKPVVLDSDYYLVYYAADWCPYCKEFQDTLKDTYARFQRMYGNVQIVFAGHARDTSNQNMIDFLLQGEYGFPYVKYDEREKTGIMNLVDVPKFWIPGFVLVDRSGKVLSSSNGQTKEDYCRDCPLQNYESLQQCDCLK